MAETSYPFFEDTAGGGAKLVSQTQWQSMAHLWASDRIDFQLTSATYSATDLPLNVTFSGTDIVISPGAAWVGGFYYRLDANLTIPAPTNVGATPRIDTVVLRADLSTGSVNVAVSPGQASTTPIEPTPARVLGGIWEMPIAAISLPANNGTKVLLPRRHFHSPTPAQVPWNRSEVSNTLPVGTFTLDMDSNSSGGQTEGFKGRDGDMVTRTLGKRRTYTPEIFTLIHPMSTGDRKGFWRYIAPGTVQFSVSFTNRSIFPNTSTAGWYIGFTLPVAPSRDIPMIFHGVLSNPENRDRMPNLISITAQTRVESSNVCALYYPSSTDLKEGLDGLTTIPSMSELFVSGVYETNQF